MWFHEFFHAIFSKFTKLPFPVIAWTTYLEFVKSMQAHVWSVIFFIFGGFLQFYLTVRHHIDHQKQSKDPKWTTKGDQIGTRMLLFLQKSLSTLRGLSQLIRWQDVFKLVHDQTYQIEVLHNRTLPDRTGPDNIRQVLDQTWTRTLLFLQDSWSTLRAFPSWSGGKTSSHRPQV